MHQHYRWSKGLPLRLDGHLALLCELDLLKPMGWSCGNLGDTCDERLVYLLEQRIIDAWLGMSAAGDYQLMIQHDFARHQRATSLADHLNKHLGSTVAITGGIA